MAPPNSPNLPDWLTTCLTTTPTTTSLYANLTPALSKAKDAALAIERDSLPPAVRASISAHPYDAGIYVANGVAFFFPGLLYGPILGLLGWTGVGPRAASVASGLQKAFMPARGLFATLQSAGMGGYGAAVVAGATRMGVAAGSVGKWAVDAMAKEISGPVTKGTGSG